MIVTEGYELDKLCQSIISMFKQKLSSFYSKDTLEKGYVIARNRRGKEESFNLVTLSIACVTNKERKFKDVIELSEYASKVKERCKEIEDSCYIID
jgi:hypothetical protein